MREKETNEIKNGKKKKNETKRKLNILDDKINNNLEKLRVNLTTLEIGCIFCEKPHEFEKERELRLSVEEKMNEIKRLKLEVRNEKMNYWIIY